MAPNTLQSPNTVHDLHDRAAAMAAAHTLAPQLSARAVEGETRGTLAPDLVADAKAAGLFRLATPRSLGGLELEPAAIIETVETLCHADGSAGWSILIGNATAFFAWLDPIVARQLLAGDAGAPTASVFAPMGRLVAGDGGDLVLDGRWTFASGCAHAQWFLNGAFAMDGGAPRMIPGRGPDWRLAVVAANDVQVIPHWDVVGLRGTGSHDVAVEGVVVPEEHTFSAFFDAARHDGALWRLPFFTLTGVLLVGFPLGVARRALDDFTRLAPTKSRAGTFVSVAEMDDVQLALARAEGGLQAARALVFDAVGELWEAACRGDVPDVSQRARFLLATQQTMRSAVDAVDTAFNMAGGSAIYADQPIQRCFRDLHTAAQHVYFSAAAAKRFAKVQFEIEQPTFWF